MKKQLNKEILKKEFFRFLKEKGKEKNSGVSILQAYKCSIILWVHRLQESGSTHYNNCPMKCFNFVLERAINKYGCDIIRSSFNWQISAHEYDLDFTLWSTLDVEWNAQILKRGYITT